MSWPSWGRSRAINNNFGLSSGGTSVYRVLPRRLPPMNARCFPPILRSINMCWAIRTPWMMRPFEAWRFLEGKRAASCATTGRLHRQSVSQSRCAPSRSGEGRSRPLLYQQGGERQGCIQNPDSTQHHGNRSIHDGAFKTLEEAVECLDQGGGGNPNLSPLMKPLNMTAKEKADLVAFLKALTGEAIKFTMPQLPK